MSLSGTFDDFDARLSTDSSDYTDDDSSSESSDYSGTDSSLSTFATQTHFKSHSNHQHINPSQQRLIVNNLSPTNRNDCNNNINTNTINTNTHNGHQNSIAKITNITTDNALPIKHESNTPFTQSNGSALDRTVLQKLCLDELLAKLMTLRPNFEWNVRNEWCRYCGARASAQFLSSPWGTKQLCMEHYKLYKERELDLCSMQQPLNIEDAINKTECTEKQYLIDILMQCDDINELNTLSIHSLNGHGFKRRSLRNKHKKPIIKTEQVSENDDDDDDDDDSDSDVDINIKTEIMSSSDSEFEEAWESSYSDVLIKEEETANYKNVFRSNYKRKTRVKEREFKCCESECGQVFMSSMIFKRHCESVHSNKRPFKCDECDKSYTNHGNLEQHIRRIHDEETRFECEFCHKRFFGKTEWRNHRGAHIKKQKKEETRTVNDVSYEISSQLQFVENCDERIGNGKFACPSCKRVFNRKESLKKHFINIHTANCDKPYQCQYCSYGAATKWQITWHENIHRNERKFKCRECDRACNNKRALQDHILNHHRKPFKCDLCSKAFGTKRYLNTHKDTVHSQSQSQSPSQRKRYKCVKCRKRFKMMSYLQNHLTRVHNIINDDTGINKVLLPRKPKDNHRPKRPLSAFFLFAQTVRNAIKAELSDKRVTQIAKEIGKRWKKLNCDEKKEFQDEALKLKIIHKENVDQYKKSTQFKEFEKKLKEWNKKCEQIKRERRREM